MESNPLSNLPGSEMPALEVAIGQANGAKEPGAEVIMENTKTEPPPSPPPAFVAADLSSDEGGETGEGEEGEEGDEIQLNFAFCPTDEQGEDAGQQAGEEGESGRYLTKSERRFRLWWTKMQQTFPGVSRLHYEIQDFAKWLEPTKAEMRERQWEIHGITGAVRELWPHAVVHVFGSSATGLCLPGSDIDLTIESCLEKGQAPGTEVQQPKVAAWQKALKKLFWQRGLVTSVVPIPKAKVPILKLVMQRSGLHVDIGFQNLNGPKAVPFVQQQLQEHAALRPLCLLLKVYLGQRNLNEAYKGGIGSYCLLNLILAHLQGLPLEDRSSDLGKILWGFFVRYGCLHDFTTEVVSLVKQREGLPRTRQQRGWGPSWSLSVEDPQAPENDIGKISYRIREARQHFSRTARHLAENWHQSTVLPHVLDAFRPREAVGAFVLGQFDDGEEYVVDGSENPEKSLKRMRGTKDSSVEEMVRTAMAVATGKKRKRDVDAVAPHVATGGATGSRVVIDLGDHESHEKAVEVVNLSDDEGGEDAPLETAAKVPRKKKAKSKKVKVRAALWGLTKFVTGRGRRATGNPSAPQGTANAAQHEQPPGAVPPGQGSADMHPGFTFEEQQGGAAPPSHLGQLQELQQQQQQPLHGGRLLVNQVTSFLPRQRANRAPSNPPAPTLLRSTPIGPPGAFLPPPSLHAPVAPPLPLQPYPPRPAPPLSPPHHLAFTSGPVVHGGASWQRPPPQLQQPYHYPPPPAFNAAPFPGGGGGGGAGGGNLIGGPPAFYAAQQHPRFPPAYPSHPPPFRGPPPYPRGQMQQQIQPPPSGQWGWQGSRPRTAFRPAY